MYILVGKTRDCLVKIRLTANTVKIYMLQVRDTDQQHLIPRERVYELYLVGNLDLSLTSNKNKFYNDIGCMMIIRLIVLAILNGVS